MIRSLEIRNYALIDYLFINFEQGLNIITGETGAGKSIMMGAMSLVMGKRADSKVLFDNTSKCFVEAKFQIQNYDLHSYFEDHDLDYADELVIRREINPNGKSRAFINDSPTTLEVVSELTDQLIDLHQQFDTLDIHKPSFQLSVIDAMATNSERIHAYSERYQTFKLLEKNLTQRKEKAALSAKELDFLSFQYKEFQELNIKEGEKEEMEAQLGVLTNAEDIKRITGKMADLLINHEQSITDSLMEITRELSHISMYDKKYSELLTRLEAAIEEIKDLGNEASSVFEETDYDVKAINQIQEKLSALYKLEKKHGVSGSKTLLAIQEGLQASVFNINHADTEIAGMEKELEAQRKSLEKMAAEISKRRTEVLNTFSREVELRIRPLGMENARMDVKIKDIGLGPKGSDEVTFFFAANKGSDFKVLKDVASGGEISRLTLVIKSIITSAVNLPTMIFDEIDSGISGEVARKMANILHELSGKHQVICITHSPQIASQGSKHFFVYKDEGSDRTTSNIKELNQSERINEIAKMLSGDPPTKAAVQNATELLQAAKG